VYPKPPAWRENAAGATDSTVRKFNWLDILDHAIESFYTAPHRAHLKSFLRSSGRPGPRAIRIETEI
jgi:hypothetical protein